MDLRGIEDFQILRVDGGLGSIILQYALALNIIKHTGKCIKFDASYFDKEQFDQANKIKRTLTINKLFTKINFNIATTKELHFYKRYLRHSNPEVFKFDEFLFTNKKPTYYSGYYSNWRYWRGVETELQKALDFSDWELSDENKYVRYDITHHNSCGVHIRRGDYINLGWNILSIDYYVNAIKYFIVKQPNLKIFFFSNDYDYVKSNIIPKINNLNYKIVDVNDEDNGHFDLYLLTLCDYKIIANSSFSISAALLGKNNKGVIAPDTWGVDIAKTRGLGTYQDMEESIQNPDYIIFDHERGNIVRNELGSLSCGCESNLPICT